MIEFKNQLPPEKITVDTSELMGLILSYIDDENMCNLFHELFSTD